ncbi:RDD family protein [Nocardioides ganghwensis]|uniref:FHA domain-containing protein n=1 Tax=Nocardioides ganghwensis TaxID=252230 RepID=A0A4Q2SGF3_9ACTN|nr:RDD family protein [Nocardioides ganghwensis]MBD3944533.1 RDD family protein [Nocardioides ganghwensis]RYC04292.1 FHA domain-containing protein [Nocardioides ganghwensis]
MTQHPQPLTYPIAQLERRFVAFAVDRLLAWGLLAAVGVGTALFVSDDVWTVVGAVAVAMVLVWLVLAIVLGVSGTSPGKAMTGLRVVHHGTGTPIGVGPALLRSFVLGASGLPTFGIGVATLAWTAVEDRGRQRRGWHDHLTDTVVVDVRPVAEVADDGADDGPRHIVNLTAMRLVPAPPVEVVKTPERSEHSVRRQPLPAELVQPPAAVPAPPHAPPHQAPHQAPHHAPRQAPQQPPQQAAQQSMQPWPQQPSPAAPPPQWQQPPQRQQPAPTRTPATSAARWRVHFDNGESFVIAGLALVGRRPEARSGESVAHLIPLASADMSVSKTHAQFGPASDGTIVVMDRGSTNGTVLVRQGVSRQLAPGKPAALVDGDKVVYGDREMTISREH